MLLLKKIYHRLLPDRRPFILAYHRVADLDVDPWNMAVTPSNFELQMKTVSGRTGGRINGSILKRGAPRVYLAFDDGYSDNFEYALPILRKFNLQATVFLATGFLGSGREYWWDRLERIFLLPGRLPEVMDLRVREDVYRLPLRADACYSEDDFARHRGWRPSNSPPTMRHLIYRTLWSILHRADRTYQDAMITALERWAGCGAEARKHYCPLSSRQVEEMSGNGIHFGAHTVNHVSAHHCPEENLTEEISRSKRRVAELTGRETSLFSYPYGDTNLLAQTILSSLHFNLACTSQKSRITASTPPLLVPRIFAGNGSLPLIRSLLS